MAWRESSFELLGVDWPEPEESMAQGQPPVDGTRERPWRQQDEVQAGWPSSGPAEHSGAGRTPSHLEQSDWQLEAQWGRGQGEGGENVLSKLSNSTP